MVKPLSISLLNAAKLIVENATFSLEHHCDKIVPVLFSAPGIGKTEIIKNNLFDKDGVKYDVEVIDMNTVSAGSLAMPIQDRNSGQVEYYLHPQINKVAELAKQTPDRPVFLALDEINRADENFTRPQLLNLLLSNTIATTTLPENVFIVGMSNLAEEEVDGIVMTNDVSEFDSATMNRLLPLHVKLNAEEWLSYAYELDQYGRPNVSPEIALYIESGNEGADSKLSLLYQPSKVDSDADNKAFATPRSWKRLSAIIDNKAIRKNPEILEPSITGLIGTSQGRNFSVWLKTHGSMIPVQHILDNPKDYDKYVRTNAEIIQFFMQAPNYVEVNGFNKQRADNFLALFVKVVDKNTNLNLRWNSSFTNARWHKIAKQMYEYVLEEPTKDAKKFMSVRVGAHQTL